MKGIDFMKKIIIDYLRLSRSYIMIKTSDSPEYDMYIGQLEKVIKEAGFNLDRIYQLADGRWKISRPFQCCKKTRREILEVLFDYFYPDGLEQKTFEECFKLVIQDLKKLVELGRRSEGTISDYNNYYNKYIYQSDFCQMNISDIKASKLKIFFNKIVDENNLTKSAFTHLKTVFSAVFDKAIELDLIEYNLCKNLNTSTLNFKEQKEIVPYTQEERQKILDALNLQKPLHLMIGLMFCLNIRVGELRALQWDQIDFNQKTIYIGYEMQRQKENNKTIYVRVPHTKSNKKEGNRYNRLSNRAIDYLMLQRKNHPFGYIFVRPDGQPFTTNDINHELQRHICPAAGVEYRSTHKNRFRAITESYKNGVDKEIIRQSAGHTSSKMTEYYNRTNNNLLIPEELNEIING